MKLNGIKPNVYIYNTLMNAHFLNDIYPSARNLGVLSNTKFIKKYSQRVPIKRMGNVEDLMTAFLIFFY